MTAATPPAPELVDARMSLGAAVLDDLFPEGPAFRRSLVTYSVLLTLAAFVASFGLFQDSTASIIGAMVIAPLGGAILAVSGALVTGRTRWQSITIVQVLLSAVWVIAIGFLVSLLIPDIISLTPALEARTQPGLLDLGVALAAGAAGAFVAVRKTGSDALPGVAIAVSLVPPLATVGICLELGRYDDAAGALLLFLTNFAAIVVVASIVFIIAKATPRPEQVSERRRLRNGLIVAFVALALITVPLVWDATAEVDEMVMTLEGAPVVESWIGDRDLTVTDYDIDGQRIKLILSGSQAPDDVPQLARELATTYGEPVDLTVEFIPLITVRAVAGG
jgi:uncharacterized hydrophobic protein (TIGR00271 family)